MKKIYFDNSATTLVDKRVLKAMTPFLRAKYGNPSSLHALGQEAGEAVAEARQKIARSLDCSPEEIVFTSGGTESDNLAILGSVYANKEKGKRLVTTEIEHPAVYNVFGFLEKNGFDVTRLPVDKDGVVDVGEVKQALSNETILVSVMHANNEIGSIQPIKEIGEICRARGVLFHSDAVQSLGKEPIDLKKLSVDLLSISSHKIHGPKGVGALFVRSGVKLMPLFYGGSQEKGLRPGTENVAGIVGFGKAAELAAREMTASVKKMRLLNNALVEGVLERVPQSFLNGPSVEKRLCNNASMRFDGIEGESLVLRLSEKGVCASTGSACSSHSLTPSRVLLAIGLDAVQAHGSLRVSLSKFSDEEEVRYFLSVLPEIVTDLRKMSPLYSGSG